MNIEDYDLNKMEDVVHLLVESDIPHAQSKARCQSLERAIKIIEAQEFMKAEGGAEARKMAARSSKKYIAAVADLDVEEAREITLKNMRETAKIQSGLYQTKSANQRQG